jgi:hypothetical protein
MSLYLIVFLAFLGLLLVSFFLLYVIINTLIYIFNLYAVQYPSPATGHVIVTGGSSGIGLEVARQYLLKGMKVTIIARNQQKLDDACGELSKPLKGEETTIFVFGCIFEHYICYHDYVISI